LVSGLKILPRLFGATIVELRRLIAPGIANALAAPAAAIGTTAMETETRIRKKTRIGIETVTEIGGTETETGIVTGTGIGTGGSAAGVPSDAGARPPRGGEKTGPEPLHRSATTPKRMKIGR
jgi:hypothetical protein